MDDGERYYHGALYGGRCIEIWSSEIPFLPPKYYTYGILDTMVSEYFEYPPQWKQHDGVLYQRYGDPKPSSKLAMFDMDNTLMLTPSTLVPDLVKGCKPWINKPAIPNDFILYNTNVKQKLQQELADGKAIVICSNQSQLFEVPRVSKLIFARIQLLLNELDIPLYILLGFRRDLCRKPGPGMLTFYEQHLNEGTEVDRANSFYVGDAAGRVWTDELLDAHCERVMALLKAEDFSDRSYVRKDRYFNDEPVDANAIIAKLKPASLRNKFEADFSDCDLKYALNNNVGFYTPEEYFANHPSMPLTVDFDPKKVGTNPAPLDVTDGMVILVGPPSGGKTFLCKNKFASFTRINEDELRTRDAGVRAARECLQRGENVIIDGANATPEKRRDYIAVSRAAGVNCTVVFLDVSVNFALHFFRYRKIVEPQEYAHLSQNVVRTYFKQLQPPDESEGFDRLLRITDETFPVQHTPVSQMHLP